jgi:clan AA aspartic protease
MGEIVATILVGNKDGGDFLEIETMVDTGSLHTCLPTKTLESLHVAIEDSIAVELADGRITTRPTGEVAIRIDGRQRTCMVVFGEGTACLLGATTLENFSLAADPVNQRLIPTTLRSRPF